jgi:hypothetical protein
MPLFAVFVIFMKLKDGFCTDVNEMPRPVVFWMVPPVQVEASEVHVPALPVTVKLPVVFTREIPLAAPLEEMLMKESAPPMLERETAVPVVVATLTSLMVTPVMALTGSLMPVLAVELICSPLTSAFVFSVTVLVRLLTVASPLFIAGKESLPAGGVAPMMVARLALASCPISFWPLLSVTAPL